MSSPVHNDLDKRSMYAPPWARETPQQPPEAIVEAIEQLRQERARAAPPPANDAAVTERQPRLLRDRNQQELPLERSDPNDIEAAMADHVRASWTPHSLEPVTMPQPPKLRMSGPSVGMVVRLGGAVALAAVVALFVIGAVPLPSIDISLNANDRGKAASVVAQAIGFREARVTKPAAPADAPPAVTLAVAALPVSAPLPAPPVAAPPPAPPPMVALPTRVPPPSGALPAEVLTAFASIDTASLAPRGARMDAPPAVAPMPRLPELRALDRDELAGLVRRGEMLLLEGDVSSARLLLRRAAEAGDASAALMLAGTYDRAELARLKVIGIAPDDGHAKTWYTKAVDLGSAEAVRRLQQLAQR